MEFYYFSCLHMSIITSLVSSDVVTLKLDFSFQDVEKLQYIVNEMFSLERVTYN